MKFKSMLNGKMYPTWISHDKRTGFTVYIWQCKAIYHMEIHFDNTIVYSTLEDQVRFIDLETVYRFAKLWITDKIMSHGKSH